MSLPFLRAFPCLLLLAAMALWGAAPPAGAAASDSGAGASSEPDSGFTTPAADTIRAASPARALRPTPFFLPRNREGPWLAPDRQLHFAGSLAIAASLRVEGRSRAESAAGAFTVGIAKEIYDATLKPKRLGRGASRKDLVADLAGALAGVLLIAAVDR